MFTPRPQRIQDLASRAYDRAIGSGAIEAGITAIHATFGENRRINDRKLAVENAMCRGAGSVRTRHDYGELAYAVPRDIIGALQQIERIYAAEVRSRRRRQQSGFPLAHPSVENKLIEARIFLRWYRRFGDHARFPLIIDALTTSPFYAVEAAE